MATPLTTGSIAAARAFAINPAYVEAVRSRFRSRIPGLENSIRIASSPRADMIFWKDRRCIATKSGASCPVRVNEARPSSDRREKLEIEMEQDMPFVVAPAGTWGAGRLGARPDVRRWAKPG